jgi:CRISPR-associated protein Csm5
MNDNHTFFIRIVAPVHIGCGEVYEPMGFVVDELNAKIIVFDPIAFVAALDQEEKERFSKICAKGTIESIIEVYKFMRCLKKRRLDGHIITCSTAFIEHYQDTLSIGIGDRHRIKQELNNFTIARTAFHPYTQQPYIPGSAIKGALRTAWLNTKQRDMGVSKWLGKAKDLEIKLLDGGNFNTDPFRMLKISDFHPVSLVKSKIVYAVNEKKKLSNTKARGPYQILEIIEAGSVFEGTIEVVPAEKQAKIKTPLEKALLFNSAQEFYMKEKVREDDELSRIGMHGLDLGNLEGLYLLRLGQHSGAECVTIDGQRSIKILKKKDEEPAIMDRATTFWFAADAKDVYTKESLMPFGWSVLHPGPAPEELRNSPGLDELCQVDIQGSGIKSKYIAPLPHEIWASAKLTWSPGDQILTATFVGKKSICRGADLVPETLKSKLIGKRKPVTAKVSVEVEGNASKIIKIEPIE